MILVGLDSVVLTPQPLGVTPAGVAVGGNALSPLVNDYDAGDTTTELAWVLLPPLIATGTTQATDDGGYALLAPATGTWTQGYRVFAMPAPGAAVTSDAEIEVTVGASGLAAGGRRKVRRQPIGAPGKAAPVVAQPKASEAPLPLPVQVAMVLPMTADEMAEEDAACMAAATALLQ